MRRRRANWSSVAIILLAFAIVAFVVCSAATSLRGCSNKLVETTETSATTTATPTPTSVPDKPSITEEEVGSYTDSELLAMFGGPREFKKTSTKIDLEPRVAATFIDGVTYDIPVLEYSATDISEAEKLKDSLCEETLSNGIYATGVDGVFREAGIIGNSDWANTFHDEYYPTKTEWWEELLEKDASTGKWFNKMDHHLIMCRYCCFIQALTYVGEVDSTKVICHFPLDPEMEVCFKAENDERYAFWVFKYTYKDGREVYIGVNKIDYRWAIVTKPPIPTPTNSPTPTPTTTTSTPTPTPTTTTSTPTPTPSGSSKRPQDDPINRNTDDNAAADIGSPSNPANHDNDMRETPEPTSPGSYDNVVTPTPTTAPTRPTSTPTTTPSPTPTGSPSNRGSGQTTPRVTPSVEPGVADDGINTGTAPNSDPG